VSGPSQVPAGFVPLKRGGPFLSSLGPLFSSGAGREIAIAIQVEQKHLNTRGVAHGGMLLTFADSALGIVIALAQDPPQPMVTVSLTADFVEPAREGEWLEARVDLQKLGKKLAFASCHLWIGERRVLRASGVFARVAPVQRQGPFEG
jgi:uncharacterized protein (TIGR00369 family)